MAEPGISTVEEAFAAAKAEMPESAAPEGVGAPPVEAAEQTPADASDHPDTTVDYQSILDSLVEQPGTPNPTAEIGSDDWWAMEVEVNGELIQLKDMRDGNLRHADYTQKTQKLAEESRALERAKTFHQDFLDNPDEFARALAVKYGYIDESQSGPIMEVDLPNVMSEAAMEAKIDELVEERIAADPRMAEVKVLQAQKAIDDEFARLEERFSATISPELRKELMAEANRRQVFDFEILLQARMAAQLEKQRTSEALARSGSSRPQSAGGLGADPSQEGTTTPTTVEEAWAQAKAEATNV